jgi:hypothetical protein
MADEYERRTEDEVLEEQQPDAVEDLDGREEEAEDVAGPVEKPLREAG